MNRRKPYIVEFTGTPEAGKTTVANNLIKALTNAGLKVKLYPESAENSKLIFGNDYNEAQKLWINLDTAKNIIEASQLSDYDVILLDRGYYDRIFWAYLEMKDFEFAHKSIQCFVNNSIVSPPDLLIILYVSKEEAIRRHVGDVHLTKEQFIKHYNRMLKAYKLSINTPNMLIQTDNKDIDQVVKIVYDLILENLKEA